MSTVVSSGGTPAPFRLAVIGCGRIAVSHVEEPASIGLATFEHDADSFLDSGIPLNVGRA